MMAKACGAAPRWASSRYTSCHTDVRRASVAMLAIGHLARHQLKAANGAAKLLALAHVFDGAAQLLLRHAQLQCGQAGDGALLCPGRGGHGQHVVGGQRDGVKGQVGHALVVLAGALGALHAALCQIDQHQAQAVARLRWQQHMAVP